MQYVTKNMAAELVNSATSDKLAEMNWTKNIEICEIVAQDQKACKDVVKAIKKRLGSTNENTQLYAVLLLEMLMNNIGEQVHKHVTESGILPILVKIVKKKTDFPVRERIFLLLDATQTSLGGASGRFPQYYNAYYDLVSAGVKFPQRPPNAAPDRSANQASANKQAPTSQISESNRSPLEVAPSRNNGVAPQMAQPVPESSIIQKASNALEVLKEVLDAVDPQNPAAAKDEFTLDLVEQCAFQKQRVMHLVITSRDEKVISRAIELNDRLQKVLSRHDALVSGRSIPPVDRPNNNIVVEEEEEEEPEQLFRRIRKGKACARPEDEQGSWDRYSPRNLHEPPFQMPPERLNRPLIRPLSLESQPNAHPQQGPQPSVAIPPPPAKHVEREKFFMENKLHSRNPSSSRSESLDFSE